ncbi:MAG: hypothetical protein H0W25_11940 [Acidimicrobiia bacterium]|nr:hypothetical protein [Acidimicrobiia bacterium]
MTYDLSFAGTEVYADPSMVRRREGDRWLVTTEEICGFLQSARVSCA